MSSSEPSPKPNAPKPDEAMPWTVPPVRSGHAFPTRNGASQPELPSLERPQLRLVSLDEIAEPDEAVDEESPEAAPNAVVAELPAPESTAVEPEIGGEISDPAAIQVVLGPQLALSETPKPSMALTPAGLPIQLTRSYEPPPAHQGLTSFPPAWLSGSTTQPRPALSPVPPPPPQHIIDMLPTPPKTPPAHARWLPARLRPYLAAVQAVRRFILPARRRAIPASPTISAEMRFAAMKRRGTVDNLAPLVGVMLGLAILAWGSLFLLQPRLLPPILGGPAPTATHAPTRAAGKPTAVPVRRGTPPSVSPSICNLAFPLGTPPLYRGETTGAVGTCLYPIATQPDQSYFFLAAATKDSPTKVNAWVKNSLAGSGWAWASPRVSGTILSRLAPLPAISKGAKSYVLLNLLLGKAFVVTMQSHGATTNLGYYSLDMPHA